MTNFKGIDENTKGVCFFESCGIASRNQPKITFLLGENRPSEDKENWEIAFCFRGRNREGFR